MGYIGNSHIAGDHTNNFKVLDDISSYTATFDGSATSVVDTTNNTIRVVEHRFIQGQRVTYTNGGGGNIGGLTTGTAYFVIFDSASTIKLATSASNAASSTAINLSAVGTGSSHTLNAAFDGVNTKFKLTHGSGTGARLNNATQINVAINNVVQRPNLDPNNFTDGFALEDNHKIVFQTAPTSEDIFWGSIIANTLTTFDISDHKIDTFTGDGSTTEFTLSHTPANNESLMVTINGVLQHPSNASTARAYTLIASIIQFTAAPGVGDEIQVRHLGFAGATTADVSGFYGRTGNVVLTSNDHITTGDITARNINASGILTASSASFGGNVSIGGTLTYEDVSNIDSVGLITARNGIDCNGDLDVDGHTNLDNVSVGGAATITAPNNTNGAFFINANNNANPFSIVTSKSSGGIGTYLFSNSVGRYDFKFENTYGGNWYTGSTFHTRILWTAPNESATTPEVCSIMPNTALAGAGGALWALQFNVTDNTSGLKRAYEMKHNQHVFLLNGNVTGLDVNSTLGVGVTSYIYHGYSGGIGDTDTRFGFSQNENIVFDTNGTQRFRIQNNSSTFSNNLFASADLDVDGHTNLDNVSIAGVTTSSGNITISNNLPTLLLTDTDHNPDWSVRNSNGNFTIYDETSSAGRFTINGAGTANVAMHLSVGNSLSVTGNISATGDIDIDGHTNLDNVSVGGATTMSGDLMIDSPSGQGLITITGTSPRIAFTDKDHNPDYRIGNSNGQFFLYDVSNGKNRFTVYNNTFTIPNGTDLDVDGHTNLDNVSVAGISTFSNSLFLPDDQQVKLGNTAASPDFKIFHDSTANNNVIEGHLNSLNLRNYNVNCTDIVLSARRNIILQTNLNETGIQCLANGATEIFYDGGVTPKLRTTATGVEVLGEVKASQDFPLVKPVLDFNFAAEKKLDPRIKFTRVGTASFVDKKGIVRYASHNEPRFDHHPTSGISLGLLLEKQQYNNQEYSTLMSQANHKNNITVTDNFAISPDGTQNASKIVNATSNNAQTNIGWNAASVASGSYAMWSIWVKSEETSCILQFYSNTYIFGHDRVNIELADGTYGGTSASSTFRFHIEKYPNKWWRISVGGNGANAAGGWYVGVVDSKTAARAATCGSATNKTWFAWGVQEEISTESRIATSYIPTYGNTAVREADRGTIDGDDFDDFFDRFQGTIINEHSNAFQSYGGGGSGWEFNNDQFQTNLINQTGSGYAANSYPGAFANVMGDRGTNGSGNGSGSDYIQAYGPNDADAQNAPANTGNGRYPSGGVADYSRYYRTWTDAMSYDVTPSENILRTATGGASSYVGGNTQSISLANISKFELGSDATDMSYSAFCGRIKRWVYFDKLLSFNELKNLTSQLPQSYL